MKKGQNLKKIKTAKRKEIVIFKIEAQEKGEAGRFLFLRTIH